MQGDLGQYEDNSFDYYKRSVREKATGTIDELKQVLDECPVISPEQHHHHRPMTSDSRETLITEHSDYSYGAAVMRLRDMLNKKTPSLSSVAALQPSQTSSKNILFIPPTRNYEKTLISHQSKLPVVMSTSFVNYPSMMINPNDVPNHEETMKILQNETNKNQQLEIEKKFLNGEIQELKRRIIELIEENRILHEELKRNVISDLVNGGFSVPGISISNVDFLPSVVSTSAANQNNRNLGKFDYEKWHLEMEKINSIHLAKTSRLETQLQYAREEIKKYETETRDLEKQLRMMDSADPSIVGMAAGLCVKCAVNEAILPPSVGYFQKQNIDSITRERDDLMDHVTLLKTQHEEMRNREEELYLQVKTSSEMVEQSEMERVQALIEREQLREEVENLKIRLEETIQQMCKRISEECEIVKKEEQNSKDHFNLKNKELLEKLSETQIELDKIKRDKMSLIAELEIVKGQLKTNDEDYGKATENVKINLTQATLDRNLALQQVERIKKEMDQSDHDRHAERLRLKQELEDVRRRLHQAEKELLLSKEECITLHNNNQTLEREVHMIKLSKESSKRSLIDDLTAADKRAELRETELNFTLECLQTKHSRIMGDLEEYNKSQSSINQKYKEECQLLIKEFEKVKQKYKGENHRLKSQNQQLNDRFDKTQIRCKELQDQHLQQSHLQEKMRERLQEMDKSMQNGSQQVQDLLTKESILMRERRELCCHVEFLQRQLMSCGEEDKINVYFDSCGLFGGILKDVRNEELKNKNKIEKKEADDIERTYCNEEIIKTK